jgi:hypothetical protein
MAKKASASGTRIVPLGDRVVLKRAEAEAKTAGGILLPDSAQGKPQRGEVVRDWRRLRQRQGRKDCIDCQRGRSSDFQFLCWGRNHRWRSDLPVDARERHSGDRVTTLQIFRALRFVSKSYSK